jgi:hypothetical protein
MGTDLIPSATTGDVMLRLTLERLTDELEALIHGAPSHDHDGRHPLDETEKAERLETALQLAYALLDYVAPINHVRASDSVG